jgi:hypothetical protein
VQHQIDARLIDAQIFLEQVVEQLLADVLPDRGGAEGASKTADCASEAMSLALRSASGLVASFCSIDSAVWMNCRSGALKARA